MSREKSTMTYIRPPDDAPDEPDDAFFSALAEKMMGALVGDEDEFLDDDEDEPKEE